MPKVVYTRTLAVNSDTEEQAVDATYRVTDEHRSAYDRTTAEAHDVALRRTGQSTPGVLRAAGYRSGARRADRGR